jgi:hypothetical protein
LSSLILFFHYSSLVLSIIRYFSWSITNFYEFKHLIEQIFANISFCDLEVPLVFSFFIIIKWFFAPAPFIRFNIASLARPLIASVVIIVLLFLIYTFISFNFFIYNNFKD